jgi:hypothetical protein
MASRVVVLEEVIHPNHPITGWHLCLQWCRYNYDTGQPSERGFRLAYRDDSGRVRPLRGQSRIPSLADLDTLLVEARKYPWATNQGDPHTGASQRAG